MSWNATRYTHSTMPVIDATLHHVRGLCEQLRKEDDEVTRWVRLADFIASLDAVEREKERAGHGVAWVHGHDTPPDYPSGEGMTLHILATRCQYRNKIPPKKVVHKQHEGRSHVVSSPFCALSG